MKTKEELQAIVESVLNECNGDRDKTIEVLNDICDNNDSIMISFAKYGAEIISALMEQQNSTTH